MPHISISARNDQGAGVSSERPACLHGNLAVVLYSTYLEYREALEHRLALADLGVLVISDSDLFDGRSKHALTDDQSTRENLNVFAGQPRFVL